ncbi:MAG: TadE/TadG family type IV pilus assembly protein [Desulfobacterales bacterium]|nr:TadE/TadG family type IV pilus assembly protein [Desulfobacterales bacterium]MDD4072497.1 TadE/TadG family type IV pilus assembly protein [Desulfobacterales bacterium]MDD4391133.1 TadE/TadG family type IV pilus assembly protein [Desulfobacterales bacterium]
MGTTFIKKCNGATAVEFALVLPVFLTLIFGIIDFGRYFFVQHSIQYATSEGTRLALVGKTISGLDRTASIIKKIEDCAASAVDPLKLSIRIFPVADDYSDPEDWADSQNSGNPGDIMRIRTTYVYQFLTPLIGAFFPEDGINVQAETTYKNELF